MKNLVSLEYTFLFDPADTWQHKYQFEDSLFDFLATKGFECRYVKSLESDGRAIAYIYKNLTPKQIAQQLDPNESKTIPAQTTIDKFKAKIVPKSFKKFKEPRHDDTTPPKLDYSVPGKTNRKKVRIP